MLRHSPIRANAEHISQQGNLASLPPPLLIKPGCLFDKFLDCRLRQLQHDCAEAITEKIKTAFDFADKRIAMRPCNIANNLPANWERRQRAS